MRDGNRREAVHEIIKDNRCESEDKGDQKNRNRNLKRKGRNVVGETRKREPKVGNNGKKEKPERKKRIKNL